MPKPVLYYVRHGLTEWNVQQRLQGRHDVPLNPEGREQAMRSGVILQELFDRDGRAPDDFVYVSSPLMRARETMELVRTTLGLPKSPYAVEPRLAEIAFGEWEGLTYDDVIKRDGDVVAKREGDKWGFRPPGGESYAEVTRPRRRLVRSTRPRCGRCRPRRHRASAGRAPCDRRAGRRDPPVDRSGRGVCVCRRPAGAVCVSGLSFDPR